jgi:hypothetical protein
METFRYGLLRSAACGEIARRIIAARLQQKNVSGTTVRKNNDGLHSTIRVIV